jgi:hypothetical protein
MQRLGTPHLKKIEILFTYSVFERIRGYSSESHKILNGSFTKLSLDRIILRYLNKFPDLLTRLKIIYHTSIFLKRVFKQTVGAPSEGSVYINTAATIFYASRQMGVGVVIRNHLGKCLAACSELYI